MKTQPTNGVYHGHTQCEHSILPSRKTFLKLIPVFVFFLASCFSSHAQVQTARTVTINNYIKGFYEYLPEGYETSGEEYPLLIFFHGAGERGNGSTQLSRVLSNGVPKLIKNGTFPKSFTVNGKSHKFIVISPQFTDVPPGNSHVNDIIDYAVKNYRVNTKRIYLTGLSMGGGMIFLYLGVNQTYAKRIAAMVPVCQAYGYSNGTAKVISDAGIRTWMTHNNGDPTVGVAGTLNYLAGINALNSGLAKATIFTSGSHDAWSKTYDPSFKEDGLNVYEWMLQFEQGAAKPPANLPPAVNAGADIAVRLPINSVTLKGVSSDKDGTISSVSWKLISGRPVAIINPSKLTTEVQNLEVGIYEFELTVTDDKGASSKDVIKVTIIAANVLPTVNAGEDVEITLPINEITLVGTGTDTDGSILSYQWTKILGGNANLLSPGAKSTKIVKLDAGEYVFQLKVIDNDGGTSTDEVRVKVHKVINKAPIANAGQDVVIKLPTSSVTLFGSGKDEDGTIQAYFWTQLKGQPISILTPGKATTVLEGLTAGEYEFELKLTDNGGATGVDVIKLIVEPADNQKPIVNAGKDIQLILPQNAATLTGVASDPDGKIVSYSWSLVSGSSATIVSQNSLSTVVEHLLEGSYEFELKIIDDGGAYSTDIVKVSVIAAANQIPTANAGLDIRIQKPVSQVTLTGSGHDPDGIIATYRWSKKSGGMAVLSDPAAHETIVSNLQEGHYEFELVVIDDKGAEARDIVLIRVEPAKNILPSASAGPDMTVVWPVNYLTLRGGGKDSDGTIASFGWSKISGPTANLLTPKLAETQVTDLMPGLYVFQLKVIDNRGGEAVDVVQITVEKPVNKLPVANAGPDRQFILPKDSIILEGSGFDADGVIVSYLWTLTKGAPALVVNPSLAATYITNLSPGTYEFKLTVKDNSGGSHSDIVIITILPRLNKLPVAYAGADLTIIEPVSSVTLKGQARDEDGKIASTFWKLLQGADCRILTPNQVITEVEDMKPGIYEFELSVTDNEGAVAVDRARITVLAKPNLKPIAHSGQPIKVIGSSATIRLDGSASSDPDGKITAYKWSTIGSGVNVPKLINDNTANPYLVLTAPGSYRVSLTVKDNIGEMDSDTLEVTLVSPPLREAPKADAGKDLHVLIPVTQVRLSGKGTSADGIVSSYRWRQLDGNKVVLVDSNASETTVMGLVAGIYNFELLVNDVTGMQGKDTVTVFVEKPSGKMTIYPNPATDKVHIKILAPVKSKTTMTIIYDAHGRIVWIDKFQRNDRVFEKLINIKSFKPGFYTVKVVIDQIQMGAVTIVKL